MAAEQDPDSTRRGLARGMHYMTWIVLLALLTFYFNDFVGEQRNPNRHLNLTDSGSGEVVLARNRAGHYVAPGRINGEPVTFLLDTGATRVSVPESLADRLGLRRGAEQRTLTANGMISVYATRLDSVKLGGIELRDVAASINPFMPEETVLLGMSFMQHLELQQRDGELTLRIPSR
ncbi:retropepsin-like aspartic protease family protein [Marinobacterium weihaiense]|uniref:TIGR02281 family clan AA aspartic protease n=1 Tax=Marinobacterium weihaiense TaxID=2851016 RepID=A0ABS6MA64_9GAMM|nr:TIGR02281 family clan AA aspartic protease [Marinobacterium weihaiense]MBV0933173.1 TIGR02281 family clan AA aspartic protease [Marinobacterium weihaiense]